MVNTTKLVYWGYDWHRQKDTRYFLEKMGFSTEVTLDYQAIPNIVAATNARVVILDLDIDNWGRVDCEPVIWLRHELGNRVMIVAVTTFSPDVHEYALLEKNADNLAVSGYNPKQFIDVIRKL